MQNNINYVKGINTKMIKVFGAEVTKQILTLVLVVLLTLSFSGCSDSQKKQNHEQSEQKSDASHSIGVSPTVGTGQQKTKPTNVVFIIADDISKDFSAYQGQAKTPHIDKLAKNGVTFTNAYATASSCSPSRNSIISGRYPHNHGAPELHMPLPEGQFLFPELLKQAGYFTVAAGKWHMGDYARQAFHEIHDPKYFDDITGASHWLPSLRDRPKEKPFFMWFAGYDAHRPWEPHEELPPFNPSEVNIPVGLPDTPIVREDIAKYYDEVARFDSFVGLVVKELIQQNVLDETLIIVTSDNGRPFPRAKTTLFEAGISIPLIMHWPKGNFKVSSSSDALVSLIDIAPTVLQLANIEVPAQVQGTNIIDLAKGTKSKVRDVLFAERNWHTQRAMQRLVRYKNFSYIKDYTPEYYDFLMVNHNTGTYAELLRLREKQQLTELESRTFSTDKDIESLYDLDADPFQLTNLANLSEYSVQLDKMRNLLFTWQTATADSIPAIQYMTKDRADRHTFERFFKGWRPNDGIVSGQDANATSINHTGPLLIEHFE